MSKIAKIAAIVKREMAGFADPRIKEVRSMGGCVCIEVKDGADLEGFQQFAYERGVFSRPFLNYMYAMVPYIITEEELVKILDTMKAWFRR
jgi:adenosylmethionine-8-amino-7-oxononanoate aminotransferase